jgi:hypothetical protein
MSWLCRVFGVHCPVRHEHTVDPSPSEQRFDAAMANAEERIETAERTIRRVHAITRGHAGPPISSVFTDARKHLAEPWDNDK